MRSDQIRRGIEHAPHRSLLKAVGVRDADFDKPFETMVAERVVISVHCHNDLGLATANTLAATRAGARQAEVIVNGIGAQSNLALKAIDSIVNAPNTLLEFSVHAVTEGIDALGEVTVRLQSHEAEPRTLGGHGADTDIIVASAKAYLAALNKLVAGTRDASALYMHQVFSEERNNSHVTGSK